MLTEGLITAFQDRMPDTAAASWSGPSFYAGSWQPVVTGEPLPLKSGD